MEADRYESLLREGAEVIEHSRLLQRTAHVLRVYSSAMLSTTRVIVADSQRVIDLLIDRVLCDGCLSQRAELPREQVSAVWHELTRRFSSAKTVAGRCEDCGDEASLHRLAT